MSAGSWNCVHVIGIDDSGAAGLPQDERHLIDEADLIIGGRRHVSLVATEHAEVHEISGDLEYLFPLIEAALGRRRAVVLASGDPCFFGIGPILAQRLGTDRVRIHPRAGSVAMAFSRIGLPWHDATVLSVHGRSIAPAVAAAMQATKVAFLTDPEHTPAAVARSLLESGIEDCTAVVCERLGGPSERIQRARLSEVATGQFDPLNVLLLLRESGSAARPALARPETAYAAVRGQITKAEVRAVAVAKLNPWDCEVLWDVGAGSGSVSIEAAALMPRGEVFAVERDSDQRSVLRTNIRRFQAANVLIVDGEAPEALQALAQPKAVFIGGGGTRLAEIIQTCAARLSAGGRLVAHFAILEHLAVWNAAMAQLGWSSDISQISVARAAPLAGGSRLAPLGPVFVVNSVRPDL